MEHAADTLDVNKKAQTFFFRYWFLDTLSDRADTVAILIALNRAFAFAAPRNT